LGDGNAPPRWGWVTPNPAPSEEDDTSSSPSRDDDEEDAFRHVAQMAEDFPPSGDAPLSWDEVLGQP
jgi:hypothetical protein